MSQTPGSDPNPGSDAALACGCTCPVMDNGRGNDELGRIRGFWVNADCPLHWKPTWTSGGPRAPEAADDAR